MKSRFFCFLFVFVYSLLFSQDVIKIDGKEIKGKYVSVDFESNRFKFIYEGRDKAVELPIDNNRLSYIKLENGKYIFKNPKITAAERALKAKEKDILAQKEQEKIRAEIKAKCKERSKIKLGIVPFLNDYSSATLWVADTLQGMCYNVDKSMVKTLGWFEKKNIDIRDINDYHIFNAQRELDYDIIVYGYVTTKQDAIITGYTPFTGVYVTAFYLDENGERVYLYNSDRVLGFY